MHLVISFVGHGQVQSVQDIMDLLPLHFGVNTMSEESVTGLSTIKSALCKTV